MNEHQLDVQQQEHQIIATGFEPVTTPLKDVALSIETYTTTKQRLGCTSQDSASRI